VSSSSARGAVASFLERLERNSAAREEGFKQLQLRVRRERGGQRRSSQQTHLAALQFLRRARGPSICAAALVRCVWGSPQAGSQPADFVTCRAFWGSSSCRNNADPVASDPRPRCMHNASETRSAGATTADRASCACRGVITAQLGRSSLLSGDVELTAADLDDALAEGSLGLSEKQVNQSGILPGAGCS